MNMQRILLLALAGVIAYFLFTDPNSSADIVKEALGSLGDGASAIVTFLRNLFA